MRHEGAHPIMKNQVKTQEVAYEANVPSSMTQSYQIQSMSSAGGGFSMSHGSVSHKMENHGILSDGEFASNGAFTIDILAEGNPPAPYSIESDAICHTFDECFAKKLLWMQCVIIEVTVRTTYEMFNMIVKMGAFIVWTICACIAMDAGDNMMINCFNTVSVPGVICTIANMIIKVIFKISFFIWKAFVKLHNFCMNPIYPVPI